MNCEQVFDVLTRGPFPSGAANDNLVEQHLEACYECRQLAEALRPAVGLLHECLLADQPNQLPGYFGRLASGHDTSISSAVMTGIRRDMSATPVIRSGGPSQGRVQSTMWQLVAVLLLAVLGTALWNLCGAGPAAPFSRTSDERQVIAGSRIETLVAFNLPISCFDRTESSTERFRPATIGPGGKEYVCCSECHYSANPRRPPIAAMATVTRSCNACHQN